ncbi:5'/3'-nucleotidase SurE [Jonquetella anthropi]|uniref:5'/3'-nucleotidase SurE n=1 Tax=Jonquetella anthropi TaxID=428712 RepID=UPI0001B915A3|nr:5'/3'-nucleotidase SurE [Jonquetella anthropi]EEX49303.1 5'/3'-nucleotidase SurE [Jonquetella anthropi E3_33 E1]
MVVTNDDGISAPGLDVLVRAFQAEGETPSVVAPSRQRSLCGHSMTLGRPVRLEPVDRWNGVRSWQCDGTPTDCVILAFDGLGLSDGTVFSGINDGANLGDDVTYSGTVAAAMEACLTGRQAVAVSVVTPVGQPAVHYETAGAVAVAVFRQLRKSPLPGGVFLNVNVPDCPKDELAGIKICHQGQRVYRYGGMIRRHEENETGVSFWLEGRPHDEPQPGCELWAIGRRCAAVTPLGLKFTHGAALEQLRAGWDLEAMME